MTTLDAYISPLGYQLWAVCRRCDSLHFHGPGEGPRAAHCPGGGAYDLRIVGPAPEAWTDDPSRVRPSRSPARIVRSPNVRSPDPDRTRRSARASTE